MTPELNKNEGLPEAAEPGRNAAHQRWVSGTTRGDRTARNENRLSGRFERHTCVPGMGAKGSSLKSRVEPRRALTEAKVYWFLRSLSSS